MFSHLKRLAEAILISTYNITIKNIEKNIILNYNKYNNVCSYGVFSYGLKNEFEIAW